DEYCTTGVFFTKSWRSAQNWVGTSAYDTDRLPSKGAIIRLPREGLPLEPDRRTVRSECLVAFVKLVEPTNMEVLFPPFTIASKWVSIAEAVECYRRKRTTAKM